MRRDPDELRARLRDARLMLVFTPEVAPERDRRELLTAVLDTVDIVQVRPKALGAKAPGDARATLELAREALDVLAAERSGVPVIVNDRVDVALALADEGCAGVHLGQDDCPCAEARKMLGPDPLIGLSTHSMTEIVLAGEAPVDYLGFGPAHGTSTKGYAKGHGAEACWVAAGGAAVPVFPIGGIDASNAQDLAEVGRAAVGSAVLCADDPAQAARTLRELLTPQVERT